MNTNFENEIIYLIKESIVPFLVEENIKDKILNVIKDERDYNYKTVLDSREIGKNDLIQAILKSL